MITLPTLLAAARRRPLPASPPAPFAPVVWPDVGHARRRMRVALNEACCAVICAQLRLLSLRISAEAETPPLGFPTL